MNYELIKAYPGHKTLGKVTTKDMSQFPEFWKPVDDNILKVNDLFQSGSTYYKVVSVKDRNTLMLRDISSGTTDDDFSWDGTLAQLTRTYGKVDATTAKKVEAEIALALKSKVAYYMPKINGTTVSYGCNTFTKSDLKSYLHFLTQGGGDGERFLVIGKDKIGADAVRNLINRM